MVVLQKLTLIEIGLSKLKRPGASISAKSATRSMGHHRIQEQVRVRQELLL